MSPFLRLMKEVSKRISSVFIFSSCIVILLFDGFMDCIVPVCVGFVWERKMRVRIPRRVRMRVSF